MFEGFDLDRLNVGEAEIMVRRGGSGPPLLLLHGNPQTHAMWHAVAPILAQHFSVVATDLRGYGDSSKPPTDARKMLWTLRPSIHPSIRSPLRNASTPASACKSPSGYPMSTPTRRTRSACCADASSDQAAVEPAMTFMNSRRRMCHPGQDHAKVGQRLARSDRSGMRRDVRY